MLISSHWHFLLFLASVLLGCLIHPAHGTRTDQVFDVQLAKDNNGGDCDAHLSVVNLMSSEVEAMVKAATDAIDKLLKPSISALITQRDERLRIAMAAEKLWKIKYTKARVIVDDENSKNTLEAIKGAYGKIKSYLDNPTSGGGKYRFACDDSWAQKVEKLATDIEGTEYKKGTPVKEVSWLGVVGEYNYAWWNKGGNNRNGYITPQNGWHPDGPCQGGTRPVNEKEYQPLLAQTDKPRSIIYFCPRVWKMKKSLASLAKDVKKDDLLDNYRTPSTVLIHEMTHQLFTSTDDAYGFENCTKIKTAREARLNADTYAIFGMAMYMNKWLWSSGRAQSVPSFSSSSN